METVLGYERQTCFVISDFWKIIKTATPNASSKTLKTGNENWKLENKKLKMKANFQKCYRTAPKCLYESLVRSLCDVIIKNKLLAGLKHLNLWWALWESYFSITNFRLFWRWDSGSTLPDLLCNKLMFNGTIECKQMNLNPS